MRGDARGADGGMGHAHRVAGPVDSARPAAPDAATVRSAPMADVAEDLQRRRRDYAGRPLDPADAAPDPIAQFERWYADATDAAVVEPNAMVLATVDAAGRPQARHVLLRGLDDAGFRFFTNRASAKAAELQAHPAVGLTFGWLKVSRAVRVTGHAHRLDDASSDAYFASRPRASRLGAWASPQSAVLGSRAELDERLAEAERRFAGVQDVPRPPFWGGYLVVPDAVDFWQGRPGRLHDRLRYRREEGAAGGDAAGAGWGRERLAP